MNSWQMGAFHHLVLEFFNEGAGWPDSGGVGRQRGVPLPLGSGAVYIRHSGLDGGNPLVPGLLRSSLSRCATLVGSRPHPPFSVRCFGAFNYAYPGHSGTFLRVAIQPGASRGNRLPLGIGDRAVPGDGSQSQPFLGRPALGYMGRLLGWSRVQGNWTLGLPVSRLAPTLMASKFLPLQPAGCTMAAVSLRDR